MLNILIACKELREPGGLEYVRADEQQVLYDTSKGWATASNALLDKAATLGGDALFCDDDVTFTAGCLDHVFSHYDQADIFGLDLHDMSGSRQQGARHVMTAGGLLHDWVHAGPAYVAHVSTSAIYIKEAALHSLRFPEWPGVHWEDVAFCLEAWLKGFKVLAVPGLVHHAIEGGIGSTKRHDPAFWPRWRTNMEIMTAWMNECDVVGALAEGVIPVGAREVSLAQMVIADRKDRI